MDTSLNLPAIFLLLLLAGLAIAVPLALVWFAWRKRAGGRTKLAATLAVAAALVAAWEALAVAAMLPGGTGVLSELQLQDGARFVLAQKAKRSLEPYTVSFYYREPGKPWGWCYIDHQDTRWWTGKLIYDEEKNRVLVFRGATLTASLDRGRSTFTLNRARRTLAAPQQLAEFNPDDWR